MQAYKTQQLIRKMKNIFGIEHSRTEKKRRKSGVFWLKKLKALPCYQNRCHYRHLCKRVILF
uniref:Uncharacterized protein n=1 Tax=Arundo donax TaxID=35708 RepID=A0A0A9HHJ8_ARUDO